ncbi:hypothetical protein GLN3_13165 [Geobacillus lituanicus]|nr:hypothetical protein GLN3_13165 [Geobacillus lituanicus]
MDLVFDASKRYYHGTVDLYAKLIQQLGIKVLKRKKRVLILVWVFTLLQITTKQRYGHKTKQKIFQFRQMKY